MALTAQQIEAIIRSQTPEGAVPGSAATSIQLGPAATAPGAITGDSVPVVQLAADFPTDPSSAGSAAFGFPLFKEMTDLMLRANADRRASIDQSISLGRFLTDLERTSPTRAARLATMLGTGEGRGMDDFDFLNTFGQGKQLAGASGGRIGSTAFPGVSIPQTFSGGELSFLSDNPTVADAIADFAEMVGLPDIFSRSQAGLIPGATSLIGGF